jgi:hypothetical protein
MEKILSTPPESMEREVARNYIRNAMLIDLSNTPDNIKEGVMDSYNAQDNKDRSKLMNYFIANRLKNLTESIGEF